VTRRGLLVFSVVASGALFVGTAVLAALGWLDDRVRRGARTIARAGDVPEGQAVHFEYPTAGEQAILLHLPGGRFVAYSQKCTHLSCAVQWQPERNRLYCPCHEGAFDPETGEPAAAPAAAHRRPARGRPAGRARGGAVSAAAPPEEPLDRAPPPGQHAAAAAALGIGILLMTFQLWLLTVALDLYLGGDGRRIWFLALVSGVVFAGGVLAVRRVGRPLRPGPR
jgi:nitrite reductase/ring-hydroxylating ferredoxin subunit